MPSSPPYTCPSTMSKRRYAELEGLLRERVGLSGADLESVLLAVRDALRFDPGASQYTAELGRRQMARRRRDRAAALSMACGASGVSGAP
jgi:hypothetical protein